MNPQMPQTPPTGFALPEPAQHSGVITPPPAVPPALPGYMPMTGMPQQSPYVTPAMQVAPQQYAPAPQTPTQPHYAAAPMQPAQPPQSFVQPQPVISMPPAPIQPPVAQEDVIHDPSQILPQNSTQNVDKQIEKSESVVDGTSKTSENEEEIDQQWIAKAQETIEKTHTDPYQESLQLSQVKAEYLKARYNKAIKVQKT